ncbi:MAG: DUF1499 domain-containing protein [Pseudomonadota bacterium]
MVLRMLTWVVIALAIVSVGLFAYVRLAPIEPERWHVDPISVEAGNGENQYLVLPAEERPTGADRASPVIRLPGPAAAAAVDETILMEPRTERIAGSPDTGMMTYVTRSALWGFPDFTTVKVIDRGEAAELAIFARARDGLKDLGVNQKRVDNWLSVLDTTIP